MDNKIELLVIKSQLGDKDSINQLITLVQFPLFRFINSFVNDEEKSKDLLQDILIIIYRKLKWVREPKYFLAWCYRIAKREAFRYLRSGNKVLYQELTSEMEFGIANETTEPEFPQVDELLNMIALLPPASKAVIILRYIDGMKLNDIAGILEINIGTVKSRLNYGLNELRKRLKQ